MRTGKFSRKTKETEISAFIHLDGGSIEVNTPIPFFTHMLEAFFKHGGFGGKLSVKGDIEIDAHHTIEDTGIVLGKAFLEALGEKKGIERFGQCMLPMDETLIECAVDLGGRFYLVYGVEFDQNEIGGISIDIFRDYFYAFADAARMNLHLNLKYGISPHHKIEACFKAMGRAMRSAAMIKQGDSSIPSTKGVL